MLSKDELSHLLSTSDPSQSESQELECKRQWWDLTGERGRGDFLHDIVGMANALPPGGQFIIGYKNGALHDSPLPRDEAELQQLLGKVSPPPNVCFYQVEGVVVGESAATVSVVEVREPFDPPHVIESEQAKRQIPVRRGTRNDFVRRRDLDFYFSNQPRRRPLLRANWVSKRHGFGRDQTITNVEVPEILSLSSFEQKERVALAGLVREARDHHKNTGFPSSQTIDEFERELAAYHAQLENPEMRSYWRHKAMTTLYFDATCLTVKIENAGTSRATNAKIRLELPSELALPARKTEEPDDWMRKPSIELRPPSLAAAAIGERTLHEQMFSSGHSLGSSFDHLTLPPEPPGPPPTSGTSSLKKEGSVTAWSDSVAHGHAQVVRGGCRLFALETVVVGAEIEIPTEVFCDEQSGWETHAPLRVQVAEGPVARESATG